MKDAEPANSVPWGWLTAIGLLVAHLVIQIGLAAGALAVLGVMLFATSRLDQEYLTAWVTNGVFVGITYTIGGLVSIALIYAVITRLRKRPFRATIGLTGQGRVWLAAFGAVLLGGVMDALTLALHKPLIPSVLASMYIGVASAAAMFVFAVIVTPLVEELLFRGVLYPVVARSFGTLASIMFVSVVFALLHVVTYGLDTYVIAQTLVAGLYLTWLRARTGSLRASVAAHAALNLYATLEAIVVVNVLR
jgi:membrane protease YdiL (CAAX protease family)